MAGESDKQADNTAHNLLVKARAVFDGNSLEEGARICAEAVEADPENADAWCLLARYGGWDSRQAELDVTFVLDASKHAIRLTSEGRRSEEAAAIYAERKKQISEQLEAIMMMPSYMGAKKLHAFMMDWLRLLKGFPELPPVVIEGEVTLVGNICQRSKLAVMPNDRLVYTSYATFNKKEPYGETFRRELSSRIDVDRARKEHELLAAKDRAELHLDNLSGLSAEEAMAQLSADVRSLREAREGIAGLSGIAGCQQELQQLQQQKESMGPFKVFKKRELDERITQLSERIAGLEQENRQAESSFDDLIAKVENKIDGLKA